jgi:hypothetical protein
MKTSKAPEFKDFWEAYPLHKAKQEAERAWGRLSVSDRKAALAALPSYRESCQRTGVAYKYPQGWLNGRRWEDEYEDAPAPKEESHEPSDIQPLSMEIW